MNIFDLQATISLNGDSFMQGVQQAQSAFSGLGSSVGAGAVAVGTMVGNMATAAVSGLVDLGKESIQTGMSFEAGMSQVAATLGMTMDDIQNNVGGAGDTFNALKTTAAAMGRETIYSATEASEGLNILAMSGFTAEQSMAMLEDVLHLAAAGSMDMGSAAGYISGSMKGFADDTKDAGYYADLMAKGATLANTSVSQLGEAMSGGAASAAAFGQSADSMAISLLRLAEQNEVGSAAATAYASITRELLAPSTDAAKAALDALGISAYTSDGRTRDLNTVVDELAEALSGMSEEEANATKNAIFGRLALDAFNKMTVTGAEKQNEWAEALAGASDGMGSAAQQYDTMTANLQGAVAGLSSAFDGLKNAIFEKLSGPLQEAANLGADALNRITAGFEEGGIKGAISALSSFAKDTLANIWEGLNLPPWVNSIADKLKSVFNKVKSSLDKLDLGGKFSGAVDQIKEAFDKIKAAVEKFEVGDKLKTVADKIKQAFDKIKSVISGWNLSEAFSGIAEKLKSGFEKVDSDIQGFLISLFANETFQNVIENIKIIGESVVFAFKEAFNGDGFSGITSELSTFFGNMFGFMLENLHLPPGVYDKIVDIQIALSDAFGRIKETVSNIDFTGIFGGIRDKIADAFGNVRDAVSGIDFAGTFSGIKDKISGAIDAIRPVIEEKIQSIKDVFADIQTIFADIGEGFGDFDTGIFDTVGEAVRNFAEAFSDFKGIKFEEITGGIKDFAQAFDNADVGSTIAEIAGKVLELAGAFAQASADTISSVSGAVREFLDGLGNAEISGTIAGIAQGAGELFSKFLTVSAEVISDLAGNIKEFFAAIPSEEIGGIVGGMAKNLGSLFDTFKTVAGNIIGEIAGALKGFWDAIPKEAVAGIIGDIAGVIGELFGHFTGAVATIIEHIGQKFEGFGQTVSRIWAEAAPAFEEMGGKFHDMCEKIKQAADALMETLQPVFEWIGDTVGDVITGTIEIITGAFDDLWTLLGDAFDAIKDGLQGFIDLLQGDGVSAAESFKKCWEDVKQFFMDLGSSFKEIGGAIVDGLKQGISDAWSSFTGWLSEMCNSLVGGVLSLFGINSPSKVFAAIGSGLVEGMEVGWGREFGTLEKQVERDLDGLTDTAKMKFADSAIGRSSAAGISSNMALYGQRGGDAVEINLVLDGDVAARALYDPLRRAEAQKGMRKEAAYA